MTARSDIWIVLLLSVVVDCTADGPLRKDIVFSPNEDFFTVLEFQSLRITCSADCSLRCHYTWLYLDRAVGTNSHLYLTNIPRQNVGYYRCTVTNPGSGARADRYFKLNVQYSSDDYHSTGAAIGIGLALGCIVSSVIAVVACVTTKLIRYRVCKKCRTNTGEHKYESTSPQNRSNATAAPAEALSENLGSHEEFKPKQCQ